MLRIFKQHSLRTIISDELLWNFSTDDGRNFRLAVPSAWESHPELNTYRGRGAYEREIYIENDANLLLNFGGVSHFADVYLDGEHLAHHYDAHTPFSAVKQGVTAGTHKLRVVADNSFSVDSTLHIPNDYYSYGGITRPVALESVQDGVIASFDFEP